MRNIYLGSGHSNQLGKDMGAPPPHLNIGYTEGIETANFRQLVFMELVALGHSPVLDADANAGGETIRVFKRSIQVNDIAIDFHFNSFHNPLATGIEVVTAANASLKEKEFARVLSQCGSEVLGINNRGVKSEIQTARGRLGWFTLNCKYRLLVEICFITNHSDMAAYIANKPRLAKSFAQIIHQYAA